MMLELVGTVRSTAPSAPVDDAAERRRVDLDEIDVQICRLFALVIDGLGAATSAFLSGDRGAAERVAHAELLIDRLHQGTEELLERQLRNLSGGCDADGLVRLVLALRIVPELERSGDLVEHIASRSSASLLTQLADDVRDLIGAMSDVAVELWKRASSTFGGVDVWSANEFRELDDVLDDLHAQICDRLATRPLPVAVAIEMGLVARFYERLGDHAVNVARRVSDDGCRNSAAERS